MEKVIKNSVIYEIIDRVMDNNDFYDAFWIVLIDYGNLTTSNHTSVMFYTKSMNNNKIDFFYI